MGHGSKKTWLVTKLNYTEEDIDRCKRLDGPNRKILCIEECPETGTPHLHCFTTWKKNISFKTIKKWLPGFNLREGDEQSLIAGFNYVNKGKVIHTEDNRQQGRRTDLEDIATKVEEGASMKTIAKAHPGSYIRYYRGIQAYKEAIEMYEDEEKLHRFKTKVYIFIGPKGVGKSTKARNMDPYLYYGMCYRDDRVVWEKYCGEKTVLFDDFSGKVSYEEMLRVCDIYPLALDKHGGSAPRRYDTVIFTSNYHYTEWWIRDEYDAFERRVTEVTYM